MSDAPLLPPPQTPQPLDFPQFVGPEPEANSQSLSGDAPKGFDEYEDRYVAFIDILGFTELISKSVQRDTGHSSVGQIFSALDIDFTGLVEDFESYCELPTDGGGDLRVHTFSDFVVASTAATEVGLAVLVFVVWRLTSQWLNSRYLSRGGVTRGKLVHRANDLSFPGAQSRPASIVFGPAFIEAYRIESSVAHFPRVLLSKDVREVWMRTQGTSAISKVGPLVRACPDGPLCIDVFAHIRPSGFDFLSQTVREIEAKAIAESLLFHLRDTTDVPKLYEKNFWLALAFNEAMRGGFTDLILPIGSHYV